MKALVLAAGYATRLYPLTKECPKSLLPIKGKPIIDYIIDKIETADNIDEIFVITNGKFLSHFEIWRESRVSKIKISLINDLTKDNEARLGAIGDMNFAINKELIDDDLLVIGGDNLFDGSLRHFLDFAKLNKECPVVGAYDVKTKDEAKLYGVIELDKEKRVIDFTEKPESPLSTLIAMCLYYFPKEKLSLISEYLKGKHGKHDAMGFYIEWLRHKASVYGYVFSGKWYDIGDHKFYHTANEKFAD